MLIYFFLNHGAIAMNFSMLKHSYHPFIFEGTGSILITKLAFLTFIYTRTTVKTIFFATFTVKNR